MASASHTTDSAAVVSAPVGAAPEPAPHLTLSHPAMAGTCRSSRAPVPNTSARSIRSALPREALLAIPLRVTTLILNYREEVKLGVLVRGSALRVFVASATLTRGRKPKSCKNAEQTLSNFSNAILTAKRIASGMPVLGNTHRRCL